MPDRPDMAARAESQVRVEVGGAPSWPSPRCGRRLWTRVPAPLIASQHQELSIDDEQLRNRIFERTAGLHGWPNRIDPVARDGLHALLPVGHEREQAQRMAKPGGAMTGGFATTPMREDERAGQSVGGDAKLGQQKPFATFQTSGARARRWIGCHLIVSILSDIAKNNTPFVCF
jgi:hypothetical protein